MENFYSTFKENFKAYEEKDPDTVDTLFSMLDIQKFVANMVECKKGVKDHSLDEQVKLQKEAIKQDLDRAETSYEVYKVMLDEDNEDPKTGWTKKIE